MEELAGIDEIIAGLRQEIREQTERLELTRRMVEDAEAENQRLRERLETLVLKGQE